MLGQRQVGSARALDHPKLTPTLAAIWKHPFFGGGGVYVGSGGLSLFQFDLDGTITLNMGIAVSGAATCTLTLPELQTAVPAGDLGAVIFSTTPSLTFTVSGAIDIRSTVTLSCGAEYRWDNGAESRIAYCVPSSTPLQLTAASGLDATLKATLDASVTLDDIVGITGDVSAQLHAGYHPSTHPVGEVDASAGYHLSACLACFWSGSPATVNIGSGTFFSRVLATYGNPPSAVPASWSDAIEVPGIAALNKEGDADLRSVSCPSPGNCSGGGYYSFNSDNDTEAFTVSQVDGKWGSAMTVPGLASLNHAAGGEGAAITSVSCAAAANCSAGGYYTSGVDSDGVPDSQAFVVSQVNGTWGTAIEVPGTSALNANGNAQIRSVSCASAGNCGAGGTYLSSAGQQEAFVVNQVGGGWGTAIEVPGMATLNVGRFADAEVESVSCGSAGNCSAGGFYTFNSNGDTRAFVVSEVNGHWGTAVEVPGTAALNTGGSASLDSVSCSSPGNCSAGGSYISSKNVEAFVVSEVSGHWDTAIEVPGTAGLNKGGNAAVNSVSCASQGNCTAGGFYATTAGGRIPLGPAFAVNEVNGQWGSAIQIPGTFHANSAAAIVSVSCASAGNCSAGGYDNAGVPESQAFVVSEINGTWGAAIQLRGASQIASVDSVSCGLAGDCAASGSFNTRSAQQAFFANETG